MKPAKSKKSKVAKLSTSSDGSDDSESSFHPDDESDSDDSCVDTGCPKIEGNCDEISEYAETDQEELSPEDNPKSDDDNKNTRQHQ